MHERIQDVGKNVAGTAYRRASRTPGMHMDAMGINRIKRNADVSLVCAWMLYEKNVKLSQNPLVGDMNALGMPCAQQ